MKISLNTAFAEKGQNKGKQVHQYIVITHRGNVFLFNEYADGRIEIVENTIESV